MVIELHSLRVESMTPVGRLDVSKSRYLDDVTSLVRIRSIALERRHDESVSQDTRPVRQGVQVYINLIIHSEVCPAVSRNEIEGAIPTYAR